MFVFSQLRVLSLVSFLRLSVFSMPEKLLPDNQLGESPPEHLKETQLVETAPDNESQADTQSSKDPKDLPEPPAVLGLDPSKPLEQFSWGQLVHKDAHHCQNCKKPVDAHPSQVVRKKGHANFSCKHCHSEVTMLYKHCDMRKLGFRDLSPEQQTEFFLKAGQVKEIGGLSWQKVKGLLQDSLTTTEIHRKTVGIRGKFLPLEVWAAKGYNTDLIKAKGEKQVSDMLLVCYIRFLIFCDGLSFFKERSSSLSGYIAATFFLVTSGSVKCGASRSWRFPICT